MEHGGKMKKFYYPAVTAVFLYFCWAFITADFLWLQAAMSWSNVDRGMLLYCWVVILGGATALGDMTDD